MRKAPPGGFADFSYEVKEGRENAHWRGGLGVREAGFAQELGSGYFLSKRIYFLSRILSYGQCNKSPTS